MPKTFTSPKIWWSQIYDGYSLKKQQTGSIKIKT